jgi:hypothetical protein
MHRSRVSSRPTQLCARYPRATAGVSVDGPRASGPPVRESETVLVVADDPGRALVGRIVLDRVEDLERLHPGPRHARSGSRRLRGVVELVSRSWSSFGSCCRTEWFGSGPRMCERNRAAACRPRAGAGASDPRAARRSAAALLSERPGIEDVVSQFRVPLLEVFTSPSQLHFKKAWSLGEPSSPEGCKIKNYTARSKSLNMRYFF